MLEEKKLQEAVRQSVEVLKSMEALRDEAERGWAMEQRESGPASKKTREAAILASQLGDACREMKRAVTDMGTAAARVTMASMANLAKEVTDAVDEEAVRRVVAAEVQRRLAEKPVKSGGLMEL